MADEDTPGEEPAAEVQANEHVKAFFLALAAKGKDARNAWRRDPANADVRVTFAGVDFSAEPWDTIDFAGFEFGDDADFSGCKWRGVERSEFRDAPDAFKLGRASFAGAIFGDGANFTDATYGDWADLAGATFGKLADFDGATFGDDASFTGAIFGSWAAFTSAIFGTSANFSGATFDYSANFMGATFGIFANFSGATFGDKASFNHATLKIAASFTGATFGDEASFNYATFGELARFTTATFGKEVDFAGATFGDQAYFVGATFGDWANFIGAAFGDDAHFDATLFKGSVTFSGRPIEQWTAEFDQSIKRTTEKEKDARAKLKQRHEQSWRSDGSGPHLFRSMSFSGARFLGAAVFSDRSFDGTADFTDARFYSPPAFDGVTNAGRIDFTGAAIQFVSPKWPWWKPHWTKKTKDALRLRAFRKIAEDTKNHDLERDLYIEERKAERGIKCSRRWALVKIAGERLVEASLVILRPDGDTRPAMLNWGDGARVRLRRAWGMRARSFLFVSEQWAAHALWIIVMFGYLALASYGRSFVRPLAWLAASVFFFRWRYDAVFDTVDKSHLAPNESGKYQEAIHMVAFANAVPFVGPLSIDTEIKRFLFCAGALADSCPSIPPPGYQWLVISQNLISITLIFFIGLALRNYFKIK
ncbi:MAG: pentapeptide repeat-containing protein [Beijerinckiaceae bacterium]